MRTAPEEVDVPDEPGSVFTRDLSPASFKKALVFLLLLGLITRIGFFVEHARSPLFGAPVLDEKYYDTVAKMLLAGQDLHELHGFRPLLYPLFVALFYKIGGAGGVELALLAQHLLGVATGWIVALLAARVFRHRLCGLAAGVLFFLAPVPLFFEGELLIESSYTFLICLGLLLVLRAADARGPRSAWLWLFSGGLTVLAAQARANILVFLAIYPLFAAWRWRRVGKAAAWPPLLGLAGALAMMVPWGVFNLRQSNHFHLMPNGGGVVLYLGNRRGADGMFTGVDVIKRLSELNQQTLGGPSPGEDPIASGARYQDLVEVWARAEYAAARRAQGRAPEADPMEISKYWTRRAMDEIRADPAAWLRLAAKKSWLLLWNVEVPNNLSFAFLQRELFWLRVLPVRWFVLLMLAPVAIWAAAKRGGGNALFVVLAYMGFYSAANVAFLICDRYRYPIWPTMAVLGGGGLVALIEILRRRRALPIAGAVAGMSVMAALSLHNWFGAAIPNFARDFQFRSIVCYDQGNVRQALADIDRSLALNPLDSGSLHHRGNVLFALNRLEEARQAYEQTLTLIPGDSGVWNNLGATLDALGRLEEALEAFRHATAGALPSQTAFLGMVFIQARLGKLDAAAAALDQLTRLQSGESAATLALKSVLERKRGETARADALEKAACALDAETTRWAIERATK